MKIKLDSNFWIDATDTANYTLMQRRVGVDKDGNPKEHQDELGYFGSIGPCLKCYMKYAVNEKFKSQEITLQEYEEACLNILEDVLKVIPKGL